MTRSLIAAMAGVLALTTTSAIAADLQRIRGTIESADGSSVVIKADDGTSQTVSTAGAKFAWVVKSGLDEIKDGVFIGTATKGDNPPTALEVVLFPESMRGTAEGHYPWDEIVDTTAGGSKVKSSMTNGTVKSSASAAPKTKSSMTNGTVKSSAGEGGEKTLTVTYDKDGSKTIAVPAKAPIVAFEPADSSIMKPGNKIFVVAAKDGNKLEGKLVGVGKDGLTPPM